MDYFNQIFYLLNNLENSVYVLIGLLVVCSLAVFFRIVICIGYQTQTALFRLNAKDIKSRSEIKDTRSQFLNKIVGDYVRIGDKAVVPNAEVIVEKHMLRFNILGFGYRGMEELVKSIEQNSLFLGIILTIVFEDFRYVFAVSTVASFLLLKLFSAIFDFTAVKEKLARDAVEYVEREVGQFYAGDMGSIFLRLKNEMSAAILRQSENLGDSIKKLGLDLAGVVQLSMHEMSKSIDSTMGRVSSFDGVLIKPLEEWKQALEQAAESQKKLTALVTQLGETSISFKAVTEGLENNLGNYSNVVDSQLQAVRQQHASLEVIASTIKNTTVPITSAVEALESQIKYIERNQNILENSVQRYELSLEDITRKLGDGLGSIVDFHTKSSYTLLNKNLEDNIKNVLSANNELIQRLQDAFEHMMQQSRIESQTIIKVKEQMDVQFEALREKLL